MVNTEQTPLTSVHGDVPLTWGPRGTHISFLSLLTWKLVKTCGEHMGDTISEVQPHGHHSNRGTLGWDPPGCQELLGCKTPLTWEGRTAGVAEALQGHREQLLVPAHMPALSDSTGVPSPTPPRGPQHYSHCYCHRPHCQVAREGQGDLGGQEDPGGRKKMHQGPGQVPIEDWALCQRDAGPFGPLSSLPCSCTHPQAQHTTDVHWVALLTLQPIHARTSLRRRSTTSASLLSPCHGTKDRAGVPALAFPPQHCFHFHHPVRTQWFGVRRACCGSTKEEAVAQRQRQG